MPVINVGDGAMTDSSPVPRRPLWPWLALAVDRVKRPHMRVVSADGGIEVQVVGR